MVFHYGQAVFEGMKAFRTERDEVVLFRPDQNAKRLNRSSERLSIPHLDEIFVVRAIQALVRVDAAWVPSKKGSSLYIRPFVIATEAALGVRPAAHYSFIIIMSPVDAYYEEGLQPINILGRELLCAVCSRWDGCRQSSRQLRRQPEGADAGQSA